MEMRKCEHGHYYDASVHASCPYCNSVRDTEKTVAMGMPPVYQPPVQGMEGNGLEATVAMGVPAPSAAGEKTEAFGVPVSFPVRQEEEDEGKTVAMFSTEQGIDPVVGWFVCLEGKEKGKEYRIHADNNFIGRSRKMDICIEGDETISRENQAILTYDGTDRTFYFSPGEGRSIVRVNKKAILQTTKLSAYDKVTIGKTELLFLPLCGEEFAWEE